MFAHRHSKSVLVLMSESCDLPEELFPLLGWQDRIVRLCDLPRSEWLGAVAQGLAAVGLRLGDNAYKSMGYAPAAQIIRPRYSDLRRMSADERRGFAARLIEARRLSPGNGYNSLSLAFVWLFQRDGERALEAARHAVSQLPGEPNAHYAQALALCITHAHRSKDIVEQILKRLAIAVRLPGAGAHIELLRACVIANYYPGLYLTPPADPAALLQSGRARRAWDEDENQRVLDLEPIRDPGQRKSLATYLKPYLSGPAP